MDFYLAEVHAGVVDYAREARWILQDAACYIPSVLTQIVEPFDGVLATAVFPPLQAWLRKLKVPVVRMACADRQLPFPAVEPDPEAIGAKAAQYLLTLGNPHFAYYCTASVEETRACWTGFSRVLRAAGHEPTLLDFWTATGQSPEATPPPRPVRWAWLRKRLPKLPRPLAVLVEDDRFLPDLYETADQLGWRVPEDLALMGQDARPLILAKLPIPSTSIDTGLYRIGYEAAALLDRLISGQSAPAEVRRVPPGDVVARRSTAVCYCSHEGVSRAITYLRRHFVEPLTLESVAAAGGVPSRTLQGMFKEATGHTFTEELTRLRLDHAIRLIRTSDLKLESVAHESGFGNARYLCEVFRKVLGSTPTAYRTGHGIA